MRADLFHRPLSEAHITDFFGGVAQVEVSPPSADSAGASASMGSASGPAVLSGEEVAPSVNGVAQVDVGLADQMNGEQKGLQTLMTGAMRAWASLGLVSLLVLVATKK